MAVRACRTRRRSAVGRGDLAICGERTPFWACFMLMLEQHFILLVTLKWALEYMNSNNARTKMLLKLLTERYFLSRILFFLFASINLAQQRDDVRKVQQLPRSAALRRIGPN